MTAVNREVAPFAIQWLLTQLSAMESSGAQVQLERKEVKQWECLIVCLSIATLLGLPRDALADKILKLLVSEKEEKRHVIVL